MTRLLLFATLLALSNAAAIAADATSTGFVVRHERMIQAPPARVYEAITRQLGVWWNPQHTYSGDSKNLSIEARPGGCFCERLADGGVEHMRVVYVKQNETLRLSGGLGPLQAMGVTGAMTWRTLPVESGTRLELAYVVGGFAPGGFDAIAPAVERVLGDQVDRLKRYVETGAP